MSLSQWVGRLVDLDMIHEVEPLPISRVLRFHFSQHGLCCSHSLYQTRVLMDCFRPDETCLKLEVARLARFSQSKDIGVPESGDRLKPPVS